MVFSPQPGNLGTFIETEGCWGDPLPNTIYFSLKSNVLSVNYIHWFKYSLLFEELDP